MLELDKSVDLWISFEYNNFDNYIRYPLGILYSFSINCTYNEVAEFISSIEKSRSLTMDRLKYDEQSNLVDIACIVASHDSSGIRSKICDLISNINCNLIVYAGDFRKNTNDLLDKYNDNKIEFLKSFQFNICPENTNNSGYVTEKIYHSLVAGCIPIYWGSNNIPEPGILNLDRILFYDENNPEELINKINRLLTDSNYANNFLNQNVFLPTAADKMYTNAVALRSKMEAIGVEFKERNE